MELYIIRHGIAAEPDEHRFPDDGLRPLTSKGRMRMRRQAEGLAALGVEFDELLTSPLVRAQQTARLVAKALGVPRRRVVTTEQLLPGADPEELLSLLEEKGDDAVLALVGHQPHLGRLIARLLAARAESSVPLKKGGVAHLYLHRNGTADPDRGGKASKLLAELDCLLTPKVLRRL